MEVDHAKQEIHVTGEEAFDARVWDRFHAECAIDTSQYQVYIDEIDDNALNPLGINGLKSLSEALDNIIIQNGLGEEIKIVPEPDDPNIRKVHNRLEPMIWEE